MPDLIQKEHYKSVSQGWHRYLDLVNSLALSYAHDVFEFNYVKEKFASMRLQLTIKPQTNQGLFEQAINCLNMRNFRSDAGIDEKQIQDTMVSFLHSLVVLHQDYYKKSPTLEKLKDVFYLENISHDIASLASSNCEFCENLGTTTTHKSSCGWVKCMCSNCSELYQNFPLIALPPVSPSELDLYAAVNLQKPDYLLPGETFSEYTINKKALKLIEDSIVAISAYKQKNSDQKIESWNSELFKMAGSFAYEYKNLLHAMKVYQKLKEHVENSHKCSPVFVARAWSTKVEDPSTIDSVFRKNKVTLLQTLQYTPELLCLMPGYQNLKAIIPQVNEVVNNEVVKNIYSNVSPSLENQTQAQQVCDYLEILQTHKLLNSHLPVPGSGAVVKKI